MKALPNLLSAARLAAAPVVFFLLLKQYRAEAMWVLAFAAITDALDGFFARIYAVTSRTGEILDPIADKALLSGAFLAMVLNGSIEIWLAVLIIGRDVLILLVGGALMKNAKRRFPPSIWGKASTISQALYILALVAAGVWGISTLLLTVLKWATAALTAWSGIDYARRAFVGQA